MIGHDGTKVCSDVGFDAHDDLLGDAREIVCFLCVCCLVKDFNGLFKGGTFEWGLDIGGFDSMTGCGCDRTAPCHPIDKDIQMTRLDI